MWRVWIKTSNVFLKPVCLFLPDGNRYSECYKIETSVVQKKSAHLKIFLNVQR